MKPYAPALILWMPLAFTLACHDQPVPVQDGDGHFSGLSQVTLQNVSGLQFQGNQAELQVDDAAPQGIAFSPRTGLQYLPRHSELVAWDPVAGRPRWKLLEQSPVWSDALVTAGNVVFYGTMDGWFKAASAETGAPLWQFKTASGVAGQPVTWLAPDGKQYVAVHSRSGERSAFSLP
ncbi:MAG TPA: PQQ-binding-like beta-propeller repeat protein [Myxococcaceae bacterium]|jgi:outer membrane protein assembly factor BamB